jgi:predicted lipoprotein
MMIRLFKIAACAAMIAHPVSAAVRDDAVANIAQKIIVPQTDDFARKADALSATLEAWVKDGSDSKKAAAAEAWKAARQSWKRCGAALFGPSQTLHTRARVDFSPANAALLTRTIGANSPLDEKYIEEQLGASQKGFGALEFLLFPGTVGGEIAHSMRGKMPMPGKNTPRNLRHPVRME